MNIREYLGTIMNDKEIRMLEEAIESGKTIIVTGAQGPTGKTTLKNVINQIGGKAIEEFEVHTVILNTPLNSPMSTLETQITLP